MYYYTNLFKQIQSYVLGCSTNVDLIPTNDTDTESSSDTVQNPIQNQDQKDRNGYDIKITDCADLRENRETNFLTVISDPLIFFVFTISVVYIYYFDVKMFYLNS